jgi:hypothetical protein
VQFGTAEKVANLLARPRDVAFTSKPFQGGRRKENICGLLPTSSTPAFDISLPVDTNIIPLFSTQPTKPIHSIRVNDFAIESEPDVDGMFQSA